MAITKLVSAGTPVPTTGNDDWQKAMAQLTALKTVMAGNQMHITQWTNTTTLSKLAMGSYIQHLGAIYVVDAEDYAIPVPEADGTHYIQLIESGVTLAVSFITDISGFSYDANFNGLYNVAGAQILPYQLSEAGSVYTKRKIINPFGNGTFTLVDYLGNVTTSALSCASVNTGQGANEVYPMNQAVRTTDIVGFADLLPTFATPLSAGSVMQLGYSNGGISTAPSNVWVQLCVLAQRVFNATNPDTACESVKVRVYGTRKYGDPMKVRLLKNGSVIETSIYVSSPSDSLVLAIVIDVAYVKTDVFSVEGYSTMIANENNLDGRISIHVDRGYNVLESLYN